MAAPSISQKNEKFQTGGGASLEKVAILQRGSAIHFRYRPLEFLQNGM